MPYYRKRPLVVEAFQWLPADPEAVEEIYGLLMAEGIDFEVVTGHHLRFHIEKSDAFGVVSPHGWLIREQDGSGFYPCTGENFYLNYEFVGNSGGEM